MGKNLVLEMREAFEKDNPGKKVSHLDATCVCLHHVAKIKETTEEKKKVEEAITPNWLWACAMDGNCSMFHMQSFSIYDDENFVDEKKTPYRYYTQELLENLFANCKGDCYCPPCWLIDLDQRFVRLRAQKILPKPHDFAGSDEDWNQQLEEKVKEVVKACREEGKLPHITQEAIRQKIDVFIGQSKVRLVEHFREFLGETVTEEEYLRMVSGLLAGDFEGALNLIKEKNMVLPPGDLKKLFYAWAKQEGIRIE
ncbi:MAG: hypothetical protein WA091_00605 [Minisyncoccales bacterium]